MSTFRSPVFVFSNHAHGLFDDVIESLRASGVLTARALAAATICAATASLASSRGSVARPDRFLLLVSVFFFAGGLSFSFRVDDFLFAYVLAYGSSDGISPFNSKWRSAASSWSPTSKSLCRATSRRPGSRSGFIQSALPRRTYRASGRTTRSEPLTVSAPAPRKTARFPRGKLPTRRRRGQEYFKCRASVRCVVGAALQSNAVFG